VRLKRTIPKGLLPFFSDYSRLDFKKDKDVIIPRALDFGTIYELRWLFKTYSKRIIKQFVKTRGFRALSARTFNFYCHLFSITKYHRPDFAKDKYSYWKY